jgi:hypothetical protein
MIAGGAAKSMSATHKGSTSRPAYLFHLSESPPRAVDDAIEVEATAPHAAQTSRCA